MENRELTILGSSAAVPTKDRSHTAQTLEMGQYRFLIDCGEGTQYQLIKHGLKYSRIQYIFISHLHGDHFLGLFGLLNTMSLGGRSMDLHIFSPPGLQHLFEEHCRITGSTPSYSIEWTELKEERQQLVAANDLDIDAHLAQHRIPCYSFRFRHGNKLRRLNIEACGQHGVPVDLYEDIKRGEDFKKENQIILNSELTYDPKPRISYTYITDSLYSEPLIEFARDCDWLYHESTFLSEETEKAHQTFHSTAQEAGIFASKAGVKNLILGHFSSRYLHLKEHAQEAEKYFKPVYLAIEGAKFNL